MKFNFKKIASVLTSTVMLSSTIAFAAAANFPEPFVKDGAGNYAIVVGAGANAGDTTAANQLDAFLKAQITDVDDDETPITMDGESFMLEKSSNKFNLGDSLNSTYSSLDDDELPVLLAEGVYEDESGDEYDYTQSIALGGGSDIQLTHFADSDVNENEEPVIGFDVAQNKLVLNYTLDFTDTPTNDSATMEETDLTFLGKTYYISDVAVTGGDLALTLLDSANSATVFSNEPVQVIVGDETYDVEIVSVDDSGTPKATLKVNNEQIASTNQGSSRKIGDDIYLSILEVSEASRESDNHYVEFSIGNGQIVLNDGDEVEINDETVDGLSVFFTSTAAGELNTMTLQWKTDEQSFLVPGDELVLPGFESVKLVVGDFVAEEKETLEVKYSSDDYVYISAPVKDGDVNIPLLYFGGDSTINNLGSDSDEVLVTSNDESNAVLSLNENNNTMFVATYYSGDEAESYVFQVTDIKEVDSGAKNETVLKNLATGESTTFTVSDTSGDEVEFGEVTLTVSGVNADAGTASVTLTSSNTYADRVVTEEGLLFFLPVLSTSLGNENTVVNSTDTDWVMNLTEEDYDTGNIRGGDSFKLNMSYATGDGPEVNDVIGINTIPVNEDSDDEEGYLVSELATKVLYRAGDDQRTVDVMYNGEESYAKVYVAAGDATSSGGGSSSGALVVTDAEVDDVDSKNLIVIGGTCVNRVAAKLLNVEASYPVCGDAWEAATGVGAGEFLIQTFNSPYTTGKVAMLVAGYNQADTTSAEAALESDAVIETTSGVKYTQSPGTTLTKG